ncbi:hypothetical protein AB0903_07035 [Streptomyces sp. NPDC048389]|uniref:hypothetical protein n=1 Tax=Streptomyces sp. NPDC048389 TaxID=3154622 RepID=UPI003456ED7D
MSRLPRYLLIWLSCTAASVTAVMITVHFVVGSTRPTAPVAQSAPEGFLGSPQSSSPAAGPSPSPSPRPTPSARTPSPTPSSTAEKPRPKTPTPAARTTPPPPKEPPAQPTGDLGGCEEGGSGVHTISSQGGKATVRYGSGGVCLISAVPNQGFTVTTSQTAPQTLTATFSAARHRSEITATTEPSDRASVRETSF